jgi:hypothetical protein
VGGGCFAQAGMVCNLRGGGRLQWGAATSVGRCRKELGGRTSVSLSTSPSCITAIAFCSFALRIATSIALDPVAAAVLSLSLVTLVDISFTSASRLDWTSALMIAA